MEIIMLHYTYTTAVCRIAKIKIEVGKLGHIVLYFNLNHRYINN